jgi:uncharacterized protein YjdB
MRQVMQSRLFSFLALVGAITLVNCDAAPPLGETGSISVRMEPAQLDLDDGASGTIKVFSKGTFGGDRPLPSDAVVRWESSDTMIAAVDRGEVRGQRPGETTVAANVTLANGMTARLTAAIRVAQVATRIEVLGGDGQTGEVATKLPEPVVVRVLDRHGNPVAGAKVEFAAVATGGSANAAGVAVQATDGAAVLGAGGALATTTADEGGISSTEWVLSPVAGTQTIQPAAAGKSGQSPVKGPPLEATANPAPAEVVELVSGDGQTGTVGTTLEAPIRIRVADRFGNGVPDVQLTWQLRAEDGALQNASPVTGADGSATAGWRLGTQVGTQEVIVSAAGVGTQLIVTATAVAPDAARVTIAAGATLHAIGATAQLTATARAADNSLLADATFQWTSSDASIASVDTAGLVTAVADGTARVAAEYQGKADTVNVIVQQSAVSVTIEGSGHTISAIGHELQLVARVIDADGNVHPEAPVSWATLNQDLVTVNASGNVKAKAVGTALVVALAGSAADTAEVHVQQVPAAVQLDRASIALAVGASYALSATVEDAAGVAIPGATLTWSSSAAAVATVSDDGVVAGVAPGAAAITARAGDIAAVAEVTVGDREVASVSLDRTTLSLAVNQSEQLRATVRFVDGGVINDAVVDWATSAAAVATVTDGLVRGVAAGSATITASTGGKSATAAVTVGGEAPPPGDNGVNMPELPRVYVDTRMPATPGRVIQVPAGGDLQAAIDSAERGDVIELAAGATYKGAFTLPPKSGSGWIVIRSSAHGQLPEGVRVTPSQQPHMPSIVGGMTNRRVFRTAEGASHWRLVGLHIALAQDESMPGVVNTIIELDTGSSHIIFDRTFINGRDGQSLQRCVIMNNAWSAVIDSWLDRCHASGFDSQAIAGWNGPGPFKIVNNYLAGAGENIMFGGARIGDGGVPADIEIRRNHIHKPLSWQGVWTVKNSFELKIAERVLFEGNLIENNWADAQVGFAVVLKSENRDIEEMPDIATRDVTIRDNKIVNSRFGAALNGKASTALRTGDGRTERVLVSNNVWQLVDSSPRAFQYAGMIDLQIVANTANGWVVVAGSENVRFVMRNSFVDGPVKGSGILDGTATLEETSPGYVFLGNAIAGVIATRYPDGNEFPSTFAGYNGPAGADLDRVDQAIAGVRVAGFR